ncbi:MAG: 2-isopropylmalate synthase [Agathobaculum sp.]|uniref:2-isopropylmalate synthase n=1 Tax=Agathobaculum sp. TaxID=2048138 RepID=UPI0025C56650|nr:2-isopropylmalate synthase [Agathobaculum sp.]MCI7125311.1 2-isopropylmalate synthase [Agathobaculum sp.]MDY3712095.1 2-isopropylmalate synthase [Agathobaculum sp.]
MGRTIKIFDTTLRDGEQSPGCSMNLQEKIEVAKELEALRVDVIEAGFAAASPGDAAAIAAIADTVRGSTICSLARCNERDIEAAWNAIRRAASPRIHTFIATSPIHMQYKLKMTPDQVLESVAHHVAYAKTLCSDVEFSAEDSTRSDLDFLCRVFEAAIKAGATTLNIPDTVGYMVPDEYAARIRYLREHTPGIENVVLSCHVHNDLGMAVAISLAGVQAGIDQIECTINGIGERAGNASMEECVMALNTRKDFFGIDCNINTKQIYRASRMLQTITGVPVAPTKPIVGANAFAHESGIHQHGVLNNKETYEIMTPESVGIPKNAIVLGKHSGRHAFEDRLRELGYTLDKEKLDKLFDKFKVLADKKKVIKDRDLEALIGAVPVSGAERYTLDRFVINSGNSITATAVIRVKKGDEVFERVAASDGPINAAFRAINKIVGKDIILEDYTLRSMTDGEDAQAEAIVKICLEGDDEVVTGRGVSVDIIEASIKAYINGINKYFID